MSLDVHHFPDSMVAAATAIPVEQLHTSTYRDIARHIQSLQLLKPDYISDVPVVMKLSDDQYDALRPSFTEPTPVGVVSPDAERVNRFGVLHLALGASIGTVLSIPSVRDGAVVQDIFPKASSRTTISSSYGSEAEFAFHNDLSFLDDAEIPDYVNLGCIRNVEAAETMVAHVTDIMSGLDDRDITELQKPQYVVRHTYHRGKPSEKTSQKHSAVLLPNGEITLGVDMTPQTNAAAIALRSLRQLVAQVATPHTLQAGEVLVLPNKQVVHARGTFTMSDNPENRRWLQRINIG
jgi:hypothetical protein